MFSRVILGMHTFNEVLMGLMIGCFSVAVYYALVEEALLDYMCVLIEKKKRGLQLGLLVGGMALCVLIDLLVFFLPNYDDSLFWDTIQHTKGCEKVKLYKSFQYKCLEDSALIMAAFGLLIALLFMPLPHNLTLPLRYSRLSCKYAAKLGLMLLSAAVPVAAFLNPGWEQIPTDLSGQALIIWGCQNLGFFTAILSLLLVAPWLCEKADLEEYGKTAYALEGEPLGGTGEVELRTSKAQSCL